MAELEARTPVKSFNPWKTLTAGLLLMLSSGLVTSLPLYEPEIKAAFGWSAGQVGNLSGVLILANSFAFVAGVLYDLVGIHYTIVVGIVLTSVGYLLLYLGVETPNRFDEPGMMSLIFVSIAGFGATFIWVPALYANAKNFPPQRRGTYFGIANAFTVLSSVAWGVLYEGFGLEPEKSSSQAKKAEPLLYLTLIAAITPAISLWFVRTLVPGGNPKGNRPVSMNTALNRCFVTTASLAVLLTMLELIPELTEFAGYMVAVWLVVCLLIVRNLPAVLVEAIRIPPDVSVFRNLRTLNFWLLFLIAIAETACFSGILSRVPPAFLSNTFIAVAFGGLVTGALLDSQFFAKKVFFLTCLGTAVSQLSLLATDQDIYVSILFGGFFYGAFFVILLHTALDMSGSQNIGRNYGVLSIAVFLGMGAVVPCINFPPEDCKFTETAAFGAAGLVSAILAAWFSWRQSHQSNEHYLLLMEGAGRLNVGSSADPLFHDDLKEKLIDWE